MYDAFLVLHLHFFARTSYIRPKPHHPCEDCAVEGKERSANFANKQGEKNKLHRAHRGERSRQARASLRRLADEGKGNSASFANGANSEGCVPESSSVVSTKALNDRRSPSPPSSVSMWVDVVLTKGEHKPGSMWGYKPHIDPACGHES